MAEERRKSLQQYLRDLAKIDEVRESEILKEFLQLPDTTDNTQSRRPKDVS